MVSQNTKVMGLLSILRLCKNSAARALTAARSMSRALIPRRTEAQKRGRLGEDLTALELEKRGYRIIARNWRCLRNEIDLAARKGDTVLFVEVKTRSEGNFHPLRALSFPQQRRIRAASKVFLREKGLRNVRVGYVFSLVMLHADRPPEIHLRRFRRIFRGRRV